jgi:hypothetical protein
MTTLRPAVLEASTYPLYQCRTTDMVSDAVIYEALASDTTSRRIMVTGLEPSVGDIVEISLILNLMKTKGVPFQTVHAGNRSDGYKRNKGLYNESATAYQMAVTGENAYFNVSQKGREDVAAGVVSKFPLATVDGNFIDIAPDFSGLKSASILNASGCSTKVKIDLSQSRRRRASMPTATMSEDGWNTTQKKRHPRKLEPRPAPSSSDFSHQPRHQAHAPR